MALTVIKRPEKELYEPYPPVAYQDSYYTSRWVAGHLPIQYRIESDKFPINNFDSTDIIASVSDYNGYAKVVLSSTYETYQELEYIQITESSVSDYNGIWQIINKISSTEYVINVSYSATSTGFLQRYYKNYFVSVKLFAGIPSYHPWNSDDPMSLISTLQITPNQDNIAIVDVSSLVRQKINTNNDLNQALLPNDLNLWTSFYIEYAESYDVVEDEGLVTFLSAYTQDTLDGCSDDLDLVNEDFDINLDMWANVGDGTDWVWSAPGGALASSGGIVTGSTPTSVLLQSSKLKQIINYIPQGTRFSIDTSYTDLVTNVNANEHIFEIIVQYFDDSSYESIALIENLPNATYTQSLEFTASRDIFSIGFRVNNLFPWAVLITPFPPVLEYRNEMNFIVDYFRLTVFSDNCLAYIFTSNSAQQFQYLYGGNMGHYVQNINGGVYLNKFMTHFDTPVWTYGRHYDISTIIPQSTLDIGVNTNIYYEITEYDENMEELPPSEYDPLDYDDEDYS